MKDKTIAFRLAESEFKEVKDKATAAGYRTVSAYFRALAFQSSSSNVDKKLAMLEVMAKSGMPTNMLLANIKNMQGEK